MPVVNINFRMDEDLKKSMESACSNMGLSMTAAFTIFAKKVSREQRIPFEVSAVPNAETIAAILEGEQMLKDPTAKKFSSVKELFEDLNS